MLLFYTLCSDRLRLMPDARKTYVAFLDFVEINDSKGGLVIHAHRNGAWE